MTPKRKVWLPIKETGETVEVGGRVMAYSRRKTAACHWLGTKIVRGTITLEPPKKRSKP